ncbi:MAG TPA: YafY family protein [Dehalococcoidia bacterium]|jgi:predicted DNA-binding transcriptional regulator YafY|nr:YafY family protein [Dehalococcoidia bacterium]
MRQMDRRLLILMRLREELPVRATDLAEECGCSIRTVYRDIDALSQAGVPVAAMPGEGYRLVPGYHLPPVAFTAEEAVQLLLGADLVRGLGTAEQREVTRSAVAKVEAVLAEGTRAEVERLRDRIRVSHWMRQEPSPWLPLLQQAVLEQRVVHMRYRSFSPPSVTERRVEPYGLVFYGNDWHMVAYCRLREAMRDFRAGRILAAELLPDTFERNMPLDWAADDTDRNTFEVRVWIDAEVVPFAREAPPYGFEREEQGEGGSVFVIRAWDLRRLLPHLLALGAAARVLSPPEVAEEMRREAEALASRYAEA